MFRKLPAILFSVLVALIMIFLASKADFSPKVEIKGETLEEIYGGLNLGMGIGDSLKKKPWLSLNTTTEFAEIRGYERFVVGPGMLLQEEYSADTTLFGHEGFLQYTFEDGRLTTAIFLFQADKAEGIQWVKDTAAKISKDYGDPRDNSNEHEIRYDWDKTNQNIQLSYQYPEEDNLTTYAFLCARNPSRLWKPFGDIIVVRKY